MINRLCEKCGKRFVIYQCYINRGIRNGSKEGRFCSKKCATSGIFNPRYNGGLEKVWFNCLFCQKPFFRIKRILINSYIKYNKKPVYCSKKCQDLHRKIFYIREKSPSWKGGIRINHGYINIYKPEHPFANIRGEVSQHRLIMEEKLNRYMTKDEVAHHINGIKTDNRIENLLLLTKSEHSTLHDKMEGRKRNSHAIKNLIPYMKNKGWNIKNLEAKYGRRTTK